MKNSEEVLSILNTYIPNPKCELEYKKDYELLIAVMLSAQTTDKRVNKVTKDIFLKYNTLDKLNKLSINEIEQLIKTIGMYKQKAKYFKSIVSSLNEIGYVPNDRNFLSTLNGIGRKSINVILAELYNEPSIAVDTHVTRVSKRLGIASVNDDVLKIERKLMKFFDKKDWIKAHQCLVLFGRYYCLAKKPKCEHCKFKNKCSYYKEKE